MKKFEEKTLKQMIGNMDEEILNSKKFIFAVDSDEYTSVCISAAGEDISRLIATLVKNILDHVQDDKEKEYFAGELKRGIDIALKLQEMQEEEPKEIVKRVLEIIERKKQSGTLNDEDRKMEKMCKEMLNPPDILPLS